MSIPVCRSSIRRVVALGALSCAFSLGLSACGSESSPSNPGTAGAAGVGVSGNSAQAGSSALGGSAGTTMGGAAAQAGSTSTTGGGGGTTGGAGTVAGAGGASAAGGAGGVPTGGAAGSGGNATGVLEGTATRPELGAAAAAQHTILKYLEKGGAVAAPVADNWNPTAGVGDVATFTSDYKVAAAGGTHTSVQAAVNAAVAVGGTERLYIEVAAGTYREVVCVPTTAPPITLYSTSANASATTIVFNNYNAKAKAAGSPANPCNANLSATTYGTTGSSTFAAYSKGFQAKNLTIANDADETGISSGAQAVALTTQGDQIVFENVRLLGNQDTFQAKTSNVEFIARVYVKGSFIEGDTDFIFGRATLVIDDSEIRFISTRQGSKGYSIVPSTDARNPYGILVINSDFTADAGTTAGTIHLGRAWDESGGDLAMYATLVAGGVYPNGQALVRESVLGAHIRAADPWAPAATTSRPFSSVPGTYPANRMFEFANTGAGSAP